MLTEHQLDLEDAWKKTLSNKQKEQLLQLVDTLSIKKNEVSITGLLAKFKKSGGFVATVLLHNGFKQPIDIHEASLKVIDANKLTFAKGTFHPMLRIKENASQPWSFIFTEEMISHQKPDLNKWDIQIEWKSMNR